MGVVFIFVTKHRCKVPEEGLKAKCQYQSRLAHCVCSADHHGWIQKEAPINSWVLAGTHTTKKEKKKKRGFLYVKSSLDRY